MIEAAEIKIDQACSPLLSKSIASDLLELDDAFMKICGSPALRPEARILLLLGKKNSPSVKEILHESFTSPRTFYNIIDKMKKDNIIISINDNDDMRVKRLSLNSDLIDTINSTVA
jgi:DNA-binding MarR family transcriptional regulator